MAVLESLDAWCDYFGISLTDAAAVGTDSVAVIHTIGDKYFLISTAQKETITSLARGRQHLEYFGSYLGEQKKNGFYPSPSFCDLCVSTTKKVHVDDHAAWLFLCGRDIFEDSILSLPVDTGHVLVCDKDEHVLGLGLVKKNAVSHVLDKGIYLRREQDGRKRRKKKEAASPDDDEE